MADTTTITNETAVQPIQLAQPAKVIDTNQYTLRGAEIYGQMSQFAAEPIDYNSTSRMAGQQYYSFKCKGAIMNVPPEFQAAFKNRTLYSVTITGKPYDRVVTDPNIAGGKKTVVDQSWTYDAHLTVDQYKATLMSQHEIKKIEAAFASEEKKMAEYAKKATNVQLTQADEAKLAEEFAELLSKA